VDLGVRHWLEPPDQATSIASWDIKDPPYYAQPYGSLVRFQFNFAATVAIRACWPPDKPDAVCSPWVEVTHR
jgi:hypothetical protein